MFIETERLFLRKLEEEDFEEFLEYANDAEMSRMMGREDLSDPAAAGRTFDWLVHHEPRAYAMIHKETGRLIGNLTITMPPPAVARHKSLAGKAGRTLSFSISREFRRKGLTFEAASHVIERLFLIEGLDYINCGYLSFNTPSRELQKKLGFTPLLTETVEVNGEMVAVIENILCRV